MGKKSFIIIISFLIVLIVLLPNIQKTLFGKRIIDNHPLNSDGYGDIPENPYKLDLDTYYGENWTDFWLDYDIRYLSVRLEADEIYFIFLESCIYWDLELYFDPLYTQLLGTPYTVFGHAFREYLTFSPNTTGYYYIKLYQSSGFTSLRLAVLQAEQYTINTTEIVLISDPTIPIRIFQVDILEGEYRCSHDPLYAELDRGWNYVVLPPSYDTFHKDLRFDMQAGSLAIIIEESCLFTLTGYLPPNETPPEDPPNGTGNDPTGLFPNDLLSNLTPVFGVGVLLGLLVLYKIKKK